MTTLHGYRRALVPLRWLLVLEPEPRLPAELLALCERLRLPGLPDVDEALRLDAEEAHSVYYRTGRDAKAAQVCLDKLADLRARATTRGGRREIAHVAADLLVDEGCRREVEALAWSAEFLADPGPGDAEVLVQRCMVLHGQRRSDEALAILDRIVEDDPLHGDARERRALILFDLGRSAEAEAQMPLTVLDRGREHFATMRGWRDPYYRWALMQRARGDLRAAIATCEAGIASGERLRLGADRLKRLTRTRAELLQELTR